MSFIVRMLKYLFWVLMVSWGVALLQKVVGKMVRGGTEEASAKMPNTSVDQKLVRDPVCGMHMAQRLAIPLKRRGETLHFCSLECRDKFLDATPKISASA
jgi:YHS domain-containing protein